MKVSVTIVMVSFVAAVLVTIFWQQQKVAAETRALQKSVAELAHARSDDTLEQERFEHARETATMLELAAAASKRPEPSTGQVAKPEANAQPADMSGNISEPDSAPLELVLSSMESSFDAEPKDQSWASAAAKSIQDGARSLLSEQSTIESVECRSSMCRMQSIQRDVEEYKKFVQQVTHSDVCKECFFTQTGESRDGRPILTMYMARPGHNLPHVD